MCGLRGFFERLKKLLYLKMQLWDWKGLADGRLLKTEGETVETRQNGEIINTLQTVVYQSDPGIKIEAPL
jgi:hypothetical protein